MKIGDKVRMIKGTEEGHIVSFKDNNVAEVEIEDGFVIPVIKSDLVVVSAEEENYFGDVKPKAERLKKTSTLPVQEDKSKGIFLAFIPINDNDLSVNLLNETKQDFLFNFSETKDDLSKSLQHGTLGAGRNTFITYVKFNLFDRWPSFHIQIIKLFTQFEPGKNFLEHETHFKAKSFVKSKQEIPSMGKEGYLIRIDEKLSPVDPNEIKESIFKEKAESNQYAKDSAPYSKNPVVDLHIEKLTNDFDFLSNEEMLEMQVDKFEKELDKAIIKGCQSIKFIHGVGNGTLRMNIHRKLSKSDQIKFFEDSDKDKFGFGATTVHL